MTNKQKAESFLRLAASCRMCSRVEAEEVRSAVPLVDLPVLAGFDFGFITPKGVATR